jgi:hypothetical protein
MMSCGFYTRLNRIPPKKHEVRRLVALAVLTLLAAIPCSAHIGSPDVFLEGNAGPYKLFVTVRVPQVIPGIAQIEIRSESNDVREIRIAPMQLTGPGSQYAPTPDVAERSKTDPQFFTGSLWLMEFGSLQVRMDVDGARGPGQLSVPVPAVAQRVMPLQKPLGILLFGLMLFLGAAIVSIASAAVREGDLIPGTAAPASKLRRAHVALAIAAVVVIGILLIGRAWWRADDARFTRRIYSPPEMNAELSGEGHLVLTVKSAPMVAGNPRRPEDAVSLRRLIPDHDHLMHFFMVRTPQMDSFWHLHPEPASGDAFAVDLPQVPPGHYQLFADVVLNSGFPVTMIGQLDMPEIRGRALTGDDGGIETRPLLESAKEETSFSFADGGQMVWERDARPLKASEPISFKFLVRDKDGKPAQDLQPYMGMAAHAEILRSDASVFAHVHPAGSVSMAALDLAQMGVSPNAEGGSMAGMPGMSGMNMPGMNMSGGSAAPIGPGVSFPYGFPKAGRYRIFVQVKRAGNVETAVFDANVN